ncbi:MAG: GumC family protein, partial [Polyangiaceae bacterium]
MQQEAQQQATEGSDAWSTVLFVWNSLRKNKILFFSAAIVTLAGAIFFTISQTKIYRSSGTIQIEPNPPRPMGNEIQSVVEMGTGSYLNNREYYETQYKILESRRISQLVVKTLGLQRDATFLANKPANTQLPSREVSVDAAAEILRSRIDIEPEKQSRLVVISVRDADPQRAQKIVTTVIQTYQEQNLDNVLQSTNSAVDWLREQQDSLKNELEKSELALHTYKKDKNILSLSFDDQSNMLRGEMQKLNELLTEVRAKKEGLAARRAELNTISADDPSKLASADLLSSPLLQRFREAYVDALQTRNSLRAAGKGPSHPELMAAEMQVSLTKKSLLNEVKNIKGAVDRDYRASAKEAAGLQKLYDAANKRALELNLMEIEFNRLKRKKDNTEKLYSMVRDRTKESDLTLMMRVNNIHVVDDATLPSRPVRPSMPVNVGAGLLLGLLLGVGMAVGRELMDRS